MLCGWVSRNSDSRKEASMRKFVMTALMVMSATAMTFANEPAYPPGGQSHTGMTAIIIILAIAIIVAILVKVRKKDK